MMNEVNSEDTAEINLEDIAEFKQSIPIERSAMYKLEKQWKEAIKRVGFVRRLALTFLSTSGQQLIEMQATNEKDLIAFVDRLGPEVRQALQDLIQLIEVAETRIILAGAIAEDDAQHE